MRHLELDFTEDDLVRELCRRRLKYFVKYAWKVIEPSTQFVDGWHIDAICDHLEAVNRFELKNLVINVPPRHMKSILSCVTWPAWVWTQRPEMRWIFASYSHALSKRDSVKTRQLIESDWYKRLWGHVFEIADDQNEKMLFLNDKQGFRQATSVGGSVTGTGADYLVVDDAHKADEARSDVKRQNVIDWWDSTMSTRVNNPNKNGKVIIMQRLNERDLAGHLIERGYELLKLPAEYEPTTYVTCLGWSDPRKEAGELLWPERFSLEAINELKKELGSQNAAGQLQQRPTPAEGGIIKRNWIKFYKVLPDKLNEQIQSWDMSFKGNEKSDYVVGTVWGRQGASKYLIDCVRDRMDMPTTIKAFRAMSFKHTRAITKIIEDKANGPAIIDTLKNEIAGIIPFRPDVSKESRLNAVAPEFEAGNIYLPDPSIAPWVMDYIEELVSFPNGAHDDQVDSTTQALLRFRNSAADMMQKLTTL